MLGGPRGRSSNVQCNWLSRDNLVIDQAKAWGQVADRYDELFVDPYAQGTHNPVLKALDRISRKSQHSIVDLGCGTGPLLPQLARQFKYVLAIDFSTEMLDKARDRCKKFTNIEFLKLEFDNLDQLQEKFDVFVSMNSLVSSDVRILDKALLGFRKLLHPGGVGFGIVPSIEGLMYHVMHLIDLGILRGMSLEDARAFAFKKAELHGYDLNNATFTFDKISQHLWLRDEVKYRLEKAHFKKHQICKAPLPWEQFAEGRDLAKFPPSFDWAFKVWN